MIIYPGMNLHRLYLLHSCIASLFSHNQQGNSEQHYSSLGQDYAVTALSKYVVAKRLSNYATGVQDSQHDAYLPDRSEILGIGHRILFVLKCLVTTPSLLYASL
jgi:hypothetical protein